MEYDKKESHVRVVISDNLEKEIQQKYPQHILYFFFRYLQLGGNAKWESEWYGMAWSEMGQNGLAQDRRKLPGRTHLENVGKCAAISQRHDKDSNCNLDKGWEAQSIH